MFLQIVRYHTAPIVALLVISSLVVGVPASAFANTATTPDDAEPNDDRTSATAIAAGDEVNGSLAAGGDVDWYAVEMTAGDGLIATLTTSSPSANQSVRVDVYDPDGIQIGAIPRDQLSGPTHVAGVYPPTGRNLSTAQIADVAEANATYYVRVARIEYDEEPGNVSYALEVDVRTLDRHDPNEDGATATRVTSGDTAAAVLAPYDSDVYAVTVPPGTTVTVTVDQHRVFEKALYVASDASSVRGGSYDGEYLLVEEPVGDGPVTFTAEEGGTYYLQLAQSGTNTKLVPSENYALTVETSSGDGGDGIDRGDGTDRPADGGDCPT